MREIPGVQWDAKGNPFANLDDYEGTKIITKEWATNTPEGQEFIATYHTEGNVEKLGAQLEFHKLSVSFANLSFVFRILRDAGQLSNPVQEAEGRRAAEDAAKPRDKNGMVLTEAQILWAEYTAFSNSSTMQQIRERMKTDARCRSFVEKNYEREWEQCGDAAQILDGTMRPNSVRGRL